MFLALVLHLLGATVWVGGHLILFFTVLPRALRSRDPQVLLAFEERYELIGIPALLLQVATGLWLAHRYVPGILPAFDLADPLHSIIAWKLILLGATALIALHARLRVLPGLNAKRLPFMALHCSPGHHDLSGNAGAWCSGARLSLFLCGE